MSFCSIASIYKYLETCAFGSKLQKVRISHLEKLNAELVSGASVLVVGDGDGRFTVELLRKRPDLTIDYVERSEGMVAQAKRRIQQQANEDRINWLTKDVRLWSGCDYDLVVTHFLLDCFDAEDLVALVNGLHGKLKSNGYWICSDFDPSEGWWARLWVKLMYLFFLVVAGVGAKKIIDPRPEFERLGMILDAEFLVLRGFIYSHLWRKP